MKFFPEDIKSIVDKISYIETCWNAGAGKVGQIRGIVGDLMTTTVLLKVFNVPNNWVVVVIIISGFLYLLGVFVFGTWMVKSRFIYRQGDVVNRLTNPQLLRTEDIVNQILKKLK